jgi:hypothetical protein
MRLPWSLATNDSHVRHANSLKGIEIFLISAIVETTLDQCVEEGKKRQMPRICYLAPFLAMSMQTSIESVICEIRRATLPSYPWEITKLLEHLLDARLGTFVRARQIRARPGVDSQLRDALPLP